MPVFSDAFVLSQSSCLFTWPVYELVQTGFFTNTVQLLIQTSYISHIIWSLNPGCCCRYNYVHCLHNLSNVNAPIQVPLISLVNYMNYSQVNEFAKKRTYKRDIE